MMNLSFEAFAKDKNGTWYLGYDHNGLYYYDNNSDDIRFIGKIPDEKVYEIRLYSSMVLIDDLLIMIPFSAKEICVYEKTSGCFTKIPVRKTCDFDYKASNADDNAKFWCSIVFDKKVYMFPHNYSALLIYDVESRQIEYMTELVKSMDEIIKNDQPYVTDLYNEGDIVFCSCANSNSYLVVDISSMSYVINSISTDVNGFNGIICEGEDVWLAPRIGKKIVKYNQRTKRIEEFFDYPEGFEGEAFLFHTFFKTLKGILLVPDFSNKFFLFDESTNKFKDVKYLSEIINKKRTDGAHATDITMAYSYDGNCEIRFISGKDNKLYVVNLESEQVSSHEFICKDSYPDQKEIISRIVMSNGIITESERLGLKDFIMMV